MATGTMVVYLIFLQRPYGCDLKQSGAFWII